MYFVIVMDMLNFNSVRTLCKRRKSILSENGQLKLGTKQYYFNNNITILTKYFIFLFMIPNYFE